MVCDLLGKGRSALLELDRRLAHADRLGLGDAPLHRPLLELEEVSSIASGLAGSSAAFSAKRVTIRPISASSSGKPFVGSSRCIASQSRTLPIAGVERCSR